MTSILPKQLSELLDKESCCVVDVREPDEFNAAHIKGSHNVPLSQIETGKVVLPVAQKLYLVCQSGVRSERARQVLMARGNQNLICIEGGIKACKNAGLVTGSLKTLPLMRQVQLVAGFLVVLGIILSKTVHPYFLGLSLFVGCGLMFSGISGFCGMAVLLSKLPFNKFPACEVKNGQA
ncbi:rhodanese-like domain-containing protein [bacterium]|nr:rhodanese-like domain-containing protein [bacterium]